MLKISKLAYKKRILNKKYKPIQIIGLHRNQQTGKIVGMMIIKDSTGKIKFQAVELE